MFTRTGRIALGISLSMATAIILVFFVFGCTYLHSIDVYACLAENTCHLADHARFIFMRSKDDAAFRFKVYTEVVKRNDFRFFPVEKGACNTMCTFIGINSERDRIGEVMSFFLP